MKVFPATAPRTWVFGGLITLALGLGFSGPASLWDPEYAARGGRWEMLAISIAIAVLFFAAAVSRRIEESHPTLAGRITAISQRYSERTWLMIALAIWVAGWSIFHGWTDPDWVASGIDWHDSHLDAYALLSGDSALYCAWRYPFYPYMAAVVSHWTGADLTISLQLVSRIVAMATAVPLFIIGRTLFGRSAAMAGIIMLVSLATYRMHTDAVTPYPMVMFLGASAAAALLHAIRGGWAPWLVLGLCCGALLANDGKSLLIALGFVGMGIAVAAITPWRRGAGTLWSTVRAFPVRLLVMALPIVGSYQWMGSLPVKAFTLEEMAVAYLVPGGRGASQAPRNLQTGYMWGHFDDALTVPRTLLTFYEAGRNPELAEQNARQLRTSLQRLTLDYPGFTWRVPAFLGLAALVPIARRRGERFRTLVQIASVGVILASCWPSIKSDYQERYVVHGAVLLPLLMMGGVDALARLIVGSRTHIRRLGRSAALILVAVLWMAWPANPVGFAQLSQRLDPVAMGGMQEFEVAEWGHSELKPGDLMLDTSWMMQALALAGSHTIARAPNAYPPGGAPWPAGAWRFTRPWPEERPASGRYFALVNYLAMAPNTFDATHVPIEELITEPDTEIGRAIAASPNQWREVFRTSDTIVRIYEYTGPGTPPRWQTTRRPM
ncbi:MAG: hypothetical protein VX944_08275 [Myxococcota bacterium]|nr:hypothetical protein [Myxococcota bacterium]